MPARASNGDWANMINMQPEPGGRSAGSLTWAGICNTSYWIDPTRRVTGLIIVQVLPFADQTSVRLYGQFERGIYNALKSA
jgi:methyl acetate hydrolase